MQKEKKKYEGVSDKIIKVMDTRSRIMKAALSNIVDRMKNEQKGRDGQNIKAYTGKIVTAYDEMIKKESMLAACNGDSDWNNIVILKKGKQPSLQNIDHVTSHESEKVPEIPEINEEAIDSVLINGLLSMFGKQKFSQGTVKEKETDDDQKDLQLEIVRLREENQYLKQTLKNSSKD